MSPADPRRISKWLELSALRAAVEEHRRRAQRIVFTNGCFDMLHAGHRACLREAGQQGDVLIVAVNSDSSVRRLKGRQRPLYRIETRLAMLAALPEVDYLTTFEQDTPRHLLRLLRPDVLVKGGTYRPHEVIGREILAAQGGMVYLSRRVPYISTTNMLSLAGGRQHWLRASLAADGLHEAVLRNDDPPAGCVVPTRNIRTLSAPLSALRQARWQMRDAAPGSRAPRR